ncbi:F0F1 ATP synthase subunit gamma [Alteromonadaceae bacterium BrNp21-10]|nr:F0F1 ATP synthase subunit gamma [Alteromonadaceae bacterium BrNp21-10]
MSDSMDSLQHKMHTAEDLKSVVRTMKAIAAGSITQYNNAVLSLDDYYRTVRLGLTACFVNHEIYPPVWTDKHNNTRIFIVFGSDQGLVGQFNQHMQAFIKEQDLKHKKESANSNTLLWTVGERIRAGLVSAQFNCTNNFKLPNSIDTITALVSDILQELEAYVEQHNIADVYLFNHRPKSNSGYEPILQRLLPLDKHWQQNIKLAQWPSNNRPQLLNAPQATFLALLREYLFVSIYKACAESLASENASRLTAMQRAENNIDELQEKLHRTFHHLRQTGIDEELFDLVGGFEALSNRSN